MPTMLDPGQDERGKELIENDLKAGQHDKVDLSAGEQDTLDQMEAGLNNGLTVDPNPGVSTTPTQNPEFPAAPQIAGGQSSGSAPGTSGSSRFRNMGKKKLIITVIVTVVSVIASIVTFILSIPFQLLHMAENLLHFNFDAEQSIEQKAHRKVLARLFQDQQHPNGGRKSATGRPIHDKLVNMKINRFNKLLAKQGLALKFDASGTLIGIEKDGKLATDLSDSSVWEKRGAIGDLVNEVMSPNVLNTLRRVKYTRVMRFHARVSWKFWTKEKAKNIRDVATEKIRSGATDTELSQKSSGNPADDAKGQKQAASNGTSDAASAIQAVKDEYANSGSKFKAIRAGTAVLQTKLTRAFGITAIIALVCTIKEMADKAAENGYIERADQLMRAGNLILTEVDQMKDGTLNLDDFGTIMSSFNGDAAASPDSIDRKGFDQSAAWKRMQGQPVVTDAASPNYTPDLSGAANPDGFALYNAVHVMDSVFNAIPGAQLVCNVATSIFGFVLQIGEVAIAILSGGAEAAAAIALQASLSFAIFSEVVPQVLEAASNLAITGTENAVNQFTQADAGLSLSSADYSRSMGGRALSNDEEHQLTDMVNQQNIQTAQEKGWFWRTFDMANYQSAFSRAFAQLPTSGNQVYAAVTSMPKTFATTFGTIFLGLKPAAAYPTSLNTYNFQYNGFTSAELDKYDLDQNEACLAGVTDYTDTATGKVVHQPACAIPAGSKTRLEMLGDPSTYTPADGDDTNSKDLMHCFVNKYRSPTDMATNDPICHSIGVMTNRTGNADNPSDAEIVASIYCKNNNVCNLAPNDDLLRFRLEMLYAHISIGLECVSTDQDCMAGAGAATGTPTSGTLVSGTAKELAQKILDLHAAGKITFQQTADLKDVQDVVNGQPIAHCQLNGPLNTTLLQLIVTLSQNYTFSINALASGHGACGGNFHDKGRAVDIGNVNGVNATIASLRDTTYQNFAKYAMGLLPNGGGMGQVHDLPTGEVCLGNIPHNNTIRTFDDFCNHIHLDVGATAP